MKKITILSLLIVFAIGLFAQQANNIPEAKFMKYQVNKEYQGEETIIPNKNKSIKATKAIYDTIYYEDFDGAIPAGWSTVDLEGNNCVWQWTDVGAQGPTTTGYEHVLGSSTDFNGWMIIDSDNYGSLSYDAILTSPAYDFSGYSSVMIVFQELYKRWGGEAANPFGDCYTYVGISTDSVIWTDIEIHADFESKDETENPGFMYINITSLAANQPTVYIRFRMQGLWDYWWQIDDLAFLEAPDNDLMLEYIHPIFKSIDGGFYNQTPKSQVMNVFFGCEVFNFGINEQTDITLNVQIDDFSSTLYDETEIVLPSLASGASEDSLGLYELPPFLPPAEVKVYNANFTIFSDSIDDNPVNNVESISFATSDTVYARDNGIITGRVSTNTWVGGSVNGDLFGVAYYINAVDTVSSISIYIHEKTNIGPSILARLIFLDTIADAWVEILTSDLFDIDDSSKLDTWVTLPFLPPAPVSLDPGYYIAALECYYNDSLFWIAEDNITPQSLYATKWKFDGNDWFSITNYAKTPFIRLNFKKETIPLAATITGATDVSCFGGSDGSAVVTATGGTPPYTYLWDDALPQSTDTATGLAAGTYNVTVTDDVANTATASVTINEPDSLIANITGTDVCPGAPDGIADLSVTGGTLPYGYQWSNGAGTQDLDSLLAGTYLVTVTDNNGCTATSSVTIIDFPLFTASITSSTDLQCNGVCIGEATVTATGSATPFSYLWDDPAGQITPIATGLCAGFITVTVTDDNSCEAVDSIEIFEPTAISITYTTTNVSAIDTNDGAIDITVTGGTVAVDYTYLWSPGGETTQDISGLTIGCYDVTITDDNSCTASDTICVWITCDLTASITGSTNLNCYGDTDGEATVTGNLGTPPYSYKWDDILLQTTATATGLSAGPYNVTVTDSMLCTATASVTITEPPAIVITVSITEVTSAGADDGAIDITVTGGTGSYTFIWSNGSTDEDIDTLSNDFYSVQVTDANSCTADTNIYVGISSINEISNNEVINIYPNPTKGELYITNAENATIYIYNIIGEVLFSIDNAATVNTIDISSLAEGAYIVRIVNDKYVITKKINLIK